MPKLPTCLSTHYLAAAYAQGWRKDRVKSRKFLLESLLKLAQGAQSFEMSAREIAQYAPPYPRLVQAYM